MIAAWLPSDDRHRLRWGKLTFSSHSAPLQGRTFTLLELLQDAKLASELNGGSVAIFRLAPADYHRYHSPMAGQMGKTIHIPGAYYVRLSYSLYRRHADVPRTFLQTVNPMVVRDKRFDAFTANKRDGNGCASLLVLRENSENPHTTRGQ